jgi:AcrR family transcriptional regulator
MPQSSTFKQLKEKEKDLRKTIIIEAAEKLFASKPFDKVSMRDIAKEAGISPASIYRHFPDQQSLFIEAFSRGTREIKDDFDSMIIHSNSASIDDVVDRFIEYFTINDQYFRMMINFFLLGPVDPEMFERLTNIERAILSQFDLLFTKMGAKKNIRFLSQTLFATLTGIVAIFRSTPDKSSEEILYHRKRIAKVMAQLFRNGIKNE